PPNTIRSSAPQCPGNPAPFGVLQIVTTPFRARSKRFRLPPAKNPSDRPFGDQNAEVAVSVPANGCGESTDSGRSQMRLTPDCSCTTKASSAPSGEIAKKVTSGPRRNSVACGGATQNCTGNDARVAEDR